MNVDVMRRLGRAGLFKRRLGGDDPRCWLPSPIGSHLWMLDFKKEGQKMLDETLKGTVAMIYERMKDGFNVDVAAGTVLGVETVQHATQTEFLPFLALPDSLAGKRIAYVVLDDVDE